MIIFQRGNVRITANLSGGRGGQSGYSSFKFGGSGKKAPSGDKAYLPPAKMNTQIKNKTYEGAFETFKNMHGNADREFMVQIDNQGFVHAYNKGSSGSVSPYNSDSSRREKGQSVRKGAMLVHNHPKGGWDIFSDADLTVTAGIPNAKGIVATSYRGMTFTVTKGSHFKAEKFANAVTNAKLRGLDYNHAVDNWLTANQKKYGYKYTSSGYRNPSRARKGGSVSLDLPF